MNNVFSPSLLSCFKRMKHIPSLPIGTFYSPSAFLFGFSLSLLPPHSNDWNFVVWKCLQLFCPFSWSINSMWFIDHISNEQHSWPLKWSRVRVSHQRERESFFLQLTHVTVKLNLLFVGSCIPKRCLTICWTYPKAQVTPAGSPRCVSRRCLTQRVTAGGETTAQTRRQHIYLSLRLLFRCVPTARRPDWVLTEQLSMERAASGNMKKPLFV